MARSKAPKGGFQPSQNQLALEARIRESLPHVLTAERDARHLTQESLAEKAGVHTTTVSKIERGQQLPSLALLILLSRALECSIEEILRKVLPETAPPTYEDRAITMVRGFPAADREKLVPVLEAFAGMRRP